MFTFKGGHQVTKGTYWDLRKGRRIDVAVEEVLPGDGSTTYLRMPLAVMLLTGPVIGLVYAVLMPVIGIVTVATLAVRGGLRGMYSLAAKSVSFGWRPGNAYLSGKKKKKKDDSK